MAKTLGLAQSSYSRYEHSDADPPLSFIFKLVEVFGERAAKTIPQLAPTPKTESSAVQPEHIEESYKLLFEAVRAAGADLMGIDPNRAAGVLRITARELARSGSEEVRRTLVREAELILGLVKNTR